MPYADFGGIYRTLPANSTLSKSTGILHTTYLDTHLVLALVTEKGSAHTAMASSRQDWPEHFSTDDNLRYVRRWDRITTHNI